MRISLVILLFTLTYNVSAQYWFGPKIGAHRTDFIYQEPEYPKDSFDVNFDYGGLYGFTVIYQATERYAVQGDLSFIRVNKKLVNKPNFITPVESNMNINYLSLPLSFRFNFGGTPIHYYVSGGPVINFWLSGAGEIYVEDFEEEDGYTEPVPYKVVFNQRKGGTFEQRAVVEANRFQYGLQFGAGIYFDLMSAGRFLIDVKYIFGHSNMGFNDNPDFSDFDYYSENFTFRNNTLSASIAYLFLFDPVLNKRGRSNNQLTKDQNKKEDKRRFTRRKKYKQKL